MSDPTRPRVASPGGAGAGAPPGSAGRVAFAEALRGPAALLVVASHFLSLYPHAQPFAASMTGQPDAFTTPPAWTAPFETLLNGPIRTGSLGVALFFLVSGYVIPFALTNRTAGGFLASRALRLLPTYWAGFALQVAVVAALADAFPRTTAEVAFGLLPGLQAVGGLRSLDGIVWTLNIEVFFYLAVALVAPALRRASAWWLALPLGAAAVAVAVALSGTNGTGAPFNLSLAATAIVFMSAGTALHLADRTPRWSHAAPLLVPALLLAFTTLALTGPAGGLASDVPSYLLAAAIFLALHARRDRITVPRALAALSAISYPLYVVHAVSGFAIMGTAIRAGLPFAAALALALTWSATIATILHVAVERPTRRAASRWGRRGLAG